MTYVLELAAHTDLPVPTVLRMLLRQPTNEAAQKKVAEAAQLIGLPCYPRPVGGAEVHRLEGRRGSSRQPAST